MGSFNVKFEKIVIKPEKKEQEYVQCVTDDEITIEEFEKINSINNKY
jgi:hypothetical protein